jgi:hypothetical protein
MDKKYTYGREIIIKNKTKGGRLLMHLIPGLWKMLKTLKFSFDLFPSTLF